MDFLVFKNIILTRIIKYTMKTQLIDVFDLPGKASNKKGAKPHSFFKGD